MVDLTIDRIHGLMHNQSNIRNISVIAHVDHGKSTLTDTLIIRAKIASVESGGGRYMDTRKDEQQRGITIKSTAISMHFSLNQAVLNAYDKQKAVGNEFLINLIDSPGHVDFSSEVTAALRVTDGALVVVDCVDGICVQTETVLRQAVSEMIVPTLCLNKLDRALLELRSPMDELYKTLRKRVEDFNAKLQSIIEDDRKAKDKIDAFNENDGNTDEGATGNTDINNNVIADDEAATFSIGSLCPGRSQVSFASGLQQWGFTLRQFAAFYVDKFKMRNVEGGEAKIARLLWAHDRFYTSDDPWAEGKFVKKGPAARAPFVVFVLTPIYRVRDLCFAVDKQGIRDYLSKYNAQLPPNEALPDDGKSLFKVVMRTWLPAADSLLEQIILQLPPPVVSQRYRAAALYEGPKDFARDAIQATDASDEAPLLMYVSKMVPYGDARFIAFGRIFAGVVRAGMRVRVQLPDYIPGQPCATKAIQRVVLMMGRHYKDMPDVPAGNIVGIIGVDSELKKTGTLTSKECFNIRTMKFSVSPVVKYSVLPAKDSDLPKLKEGLNKLSKSDPCCLVNYNDNGECTVAGAGELHLEIAFNDLEEYANIAIKKGEPLVQYIEGISKATTEAKMSKSANKHNRIYMTSETLPEEIVKAIQDKKIVSKDPKIRSQLFKDHLNITDDYVKKILFYGPEDEGPNILVDETKGIAYLNEIKECMRDGFREVTQRGPLVGESLRGVRFNLTDLALHADAIHRTGNQITAPVISVCKGLIMASDPILYEPLFSIEINVPNEEVSAASNVLIKRRGIIEEYKESGSRQILVGLLPVRESFGLSPALMDAANGKASFMCCFSHYDVLPGAFDNPGSITNTVISEIRQRRGLGELKLADSYFDRL